MLRITIVLVAPKYDSLFTSEAVDDYLKAIFELSGPSEEVVTGNALAGRLGVRAASVTGMLQKLAARRPSFVRYEKRRGVRLTEAGRRRALEVLRHHRLLERFLHECLGFSWDEVHEDAERLEHFISERLEDRIAAKLGEPNIDPHGHLIPERSGSLPFRSETPLLDWACGVPARISSVSDRDPAALREIERLGLTPGVQLVVAPGSRNASLLVHIPTAGDPVRVSRRLAEAISVSPA